MSFPNQLSVLRILLTPLFLYLFLSENIVYKKLSLIVFFIAVSTDWIDGWHARKYGLISAFGIFIDPLADKILTSAAFAGFYILGIMPLWMVIVIVSRDIIITLLRSYKEYKGYTNLTSIPGNSKIETPRLSVRFKTRQKLLSGRLIFSFVSFYQPSLEKIENAIFRCEASLEVPITKSIFLNAVYKYTDDDIVSAGRKRSDTKLTFGAGYSF